MEAAVVLGGGVHLFDDLGHGSNTDAEWLALIRALECAQSQGLDHVILLGDSREVVLACQRALRDGGNDAGGQAASHHLRTAMTLMAGVADLRIRWIKREQNLAGIALNARHVR